MSNHMANNKKKSANRPGSRAVQSPGRRPSKRELAAGRVGRRMSPTTSWGLLGLGIAICFYWVSINVLNALFPLAA